MAKKARRTTHRSSTGTKLYAVRDAQGRFKDIQTYKRAHGQDIKRRAKGRSNRPDVPTHLRSMQTHSDARRVGACGSDLRSRQ